MAKRKSKARKKRRFTLPLAIVAGFTLPTYNIAVHTQNYGVQGGIREAGRILFGWDYQTGAWDWRHMRYGILPILLGAIMHRFIGTQLGVNRAMARAGIPIIRL